MSRVIIPLGGLFPPKTQVMVIDAVAVLTRRLGKSLLDPF